MLIVKNLIFVNGDCATSFIVMVMKFKIPQLHMFSYIFGKFEVSILHRTRDIRLRTGKVVFFEHPVYFMY